MTETAYITGEETAATHCTTGWLKDFLNTATSAELREFADSVCLNGHHDNFDSVFEGVDVPFTDNDEAEDFRVGYMHAVWEHVSDRIALLEDEARFAAESEFDDEEEDEADFIQPAAATEISPA